MQASRRGRGDSFQAAPYRPAFRQPENNKPHPATHPLKPKAA
ncbi:hypothetical protein [Kingella sp. (in: b-proteobacteria)]|nr:hypothetical protein [Kingella sp. (in: b-proteobacteria)]MDO4657157.1 hypothetical protein [Kingella sp. (in: b-proteobacteria)]